MSDPKRPSEEEYFAKLDKENEEKLALRLAAEKAAAERAELKALHHHRCGKCGMPMREQDFRGILIDVCGDCGAVLLSNRELHQLAGDDETSVFSVLAEMFKFRAKPTA